MALDVKRTARILAYAGHDGVKRKYSDAPYFKHVERVAKRAEALGLPDFVVAAGYDHDVDEDCEEYFRELLRLLLPAEVITLVGELTNPSKQHPELRRRLRKEMDQQCLQHVSYYAKALKFIDRIDNVRDCENAERGFQELYAGESLLLRDALMFGFEQDALLLSLYKELTDAITDLQLAAMRKGLKYG